METSDYYSEGCRKLEAGQYEEAIRAFNKAIELKPDYADAYVNRGIAKVKLGKNEEAISDYDEAIKIDPKNTNAYHNKGVAMALLEAQNTEEVVREEYEKQLEEQRQRFDQELKQKLRESQKMIAESLNYEELLSYFENDLEKAQERHALCLKRLKFTAFIVYGGFTVVGIGAILYLGKEGAFWAIMPSFVTIAVLLLIPFYLAERTANKHKDYMLALQEDIRTKQALAVLSEHYTGDKNEALFKLFHYVQSGIPALISGMKEKSAGINPIAEWFNLAKKRKNRSVFSG